MEVFIFKVGKNIQTIPIYFYFTTIVTQNEMCEKRLVGIRLHSNTIMAFDVSLRNKTIPQVYSQKSCINNINITYKYCNINKSWCTGACFFANFPHKIRSWIVFNSLPRVVIGSSSLEHFVKDGYTVEIFVTISLDYDKSLL